MTRLLVTLYLLAGPIHRVDAVTCQPNSQLEDTMELLQVESIISRNKHQSKQHHLSEGQQAAQHDLVMVDIPFNFGYTVAAVAAMGSGNGGMAARRKISSLHEGSWPEARRLAQDMDGAEYWGPMNPDILGTSSVGCPMASTPQKHWPKELAERYFGNKTIFGMLRDPYERMTAVFRSGSLQKDAEDAEFHSKCDVSSAVKKKMKQYLAGDKYADGCKFLPQAEFFDGPFGITEPVDNREFPLSANKLLESHGYKNMHIQTKDVMHIHGCDNTWPGDMDDEAKELVQEVYKRDFELICKHFGYCEEKESTCLTRVEQMCPQKLFDWDSKGEQWIRRTK